MILTAHQQFIDHARFYLESRGIDPRENLLTYEYESNEARFAAWLVESLLYAYRELAHQKCDRKIVLRCWGQVCEYRGRVRDWPTWWAHEASLELQTILERWVATCS